MFSTELEEDYKRARKNVKEADRNLEEINQELRDSKKELKATKEAGTSFNSHDEWAANVDKLEIKVKEANALFKEALVRVELAETKLSLAVANQGRIYSAAAIDGSYQGLNLTEWKNKVEKAEENLSKVSSKLDNFNIRPLDSIFN